MKSKNMCRIWVSNDYGKKLKREALDNDMSILDYTDILAREEKKDDKRKKIWNL